MKTIAILAILMLSGCGHVSVKTFHENGSPAWDISENTLGKNLAGVTAEVKTPDGTIVKFGMDGSSVEVQMMNMIMASQQALMQAILTGQLVPAPVK